MVTIRNLTYDIHNEDYSVFDKVNEYLELVLYLLRNTTKKESGITVRPKIPKRVGFANSKKAEAAKLTISKKLKEEQNNVIEEGVVDDIKVDNVTSFTTNIPVYQIFEIESDDEEVDEKPPPRSALKYGDLKLISNNRMLTDTIINAAQNIIHLQHLSIARLQDTLPAKFPF